MTDRLINRRDVVAAGITLPVAGVAAVAGQISAASPGTARPAPADLSFLRSEPLLDAARLRTLMRREGLDAIVTAQPANTLYLTGHWPQLDRMGWRSAGLGIFCADPAKPLGVVMHAFLYYYTHSPERDAFGDRIVFPYTQPAASAEPTAEDEEPPPAPVRTMRVRDPALLSARNRHRAHALELARPVSADASWALAKAMREFGLERARIGIDDPELETALRRRGFGGQTIAAENTLRRARLAKSPAEIRLMRIAAAANVEAALAAARAVREAGTTRGLRARFFAEAASRGNLGVFMVVNGTSSDVVDEPIVEGMAFSIDCVSHCRFYHGDFARTVFVGEPSASARQATRAIATAWADIRSQLRPGLRFADIPRIGRESIRKQGLDLNVSFTPHSVGLFHTDHPQPSLLSARGPDDLVLEENMVLSVDCPVLESGLGGTMHLEDLTLIRADGGEPLHDVPPPVIQV
jgi:Xaa-Pro aminopeptidase